MNNEIFSMNTLIPVIILVAFATYFVVFNLNSIVRLCRFAYTTQRSRLLSEMKKDSSIFWNARGARFETFSFKPQRETIKPSEWLVSLYLMKKIPGAVVGGLKKAWPRRKRRDSEAG